MAKALALFQYQISGEYLTSFTVTHKGDVTDECNALPFLYVVAVIKREGKKVTPFGGFIVKTDIPKDDPNLMSSMYQMAQALDKVSPRLKYGNTLQIVPKQHQLTTLPNEKECEEMVGAALFLYGWNGNA